MKMSGHSGARRRREPGIYNLGCNDPAAARYMDSGQPLGGFRNDGGGPRQPIAVPLSQRRAEFCSALAGVFLLFPSFAQAQDVAAFYKGRSISMFIASAVGGGYDAYARLVGRHIGKYIPGQSDDRRR